MASITQINNKIHQYIFLRNFKGVIDLLEDEKYNIKNKINFFKISYRLYMKENLETGIKRSYRLEAIGLYKKVMEHYGENTESSPAEGIKMLVAS